MPLHWHAHGKALIDSPIKDGIVKEVHDETMDWVSPAFFVPKSNGRIRIVTDFTHLNCCIKRPVHPFPSASDIMANIPHGSTHFAKLDAIQGYHQIPLADESKDLTTFLLPWGKYRYC